MKPQLSKCLSVCFLCLWTITVTATQQGSPPPQTGTIIGTVMDVGGGVVPAAEVILDGPSAEDNQHVVADNNGYFKFEHVKPGIPYRAIVSAERFADWTSNELVLVPGQFLILSSISLRIQAVRVTVNAVLPEERAAEQVRTEEQQRILGVIPNFYVVYDRRAVPLTPKLKFQLAFRTLRDPITMAGFGVNAAIYQMSAYPGYREGAKGYAERLGATFAGGYTNIMIGDALFPSLLHQDPRYFYQGTGTRKSRLLHALSSPLFTKGDDGQREINYSNLAGDLASGAIANAYYPPQDRGAWRVFSSALIGAGGRMVEGVVQEFLLHKHNSATSSP